MGGTSTKLPGPAMPPSVTGGPGLHYRTPKDVAIGRGRGARMKCRAESAQEIPRQGGVEQDGIRAPQDEYPKWRPEHAHPRAVSRCVPAGIDRGEPSKAVLIAPKPSTNHQEAAKKSDLLVAKKRPMEAGPSPAVQRTTKNPPSSVLLNKLRMKQAAKASLESDSTCDSSSSYYSLESCSDSRSKRQESLPAGDAGPPQLKREPKRDSEVSDLLLDQDPRGRAVCPVKSVFDIENLHPALVRFLQGQEVDAPKPLQGNFRYIANV